ncbi:hypothetical protein TELCIR_02402 [Teladorsagia circumcincta]|uniref:Prolyl 4-hydroxylase alpha subunit Fe(2+) 2OG dioxygenase domain-containing protein n=1 Tax=Teladorsagia circumcincta TaxID=45464 RepID=A0A2G9V0Q7_TELCI|nr:hypothetical protein TELCIR_02402 [Teladorsagia circumcincta]
MEMELERVVDGISPKPIYDHSRRANGTWIDDEETAGVAKVSKRAKAMLPFSRIVMLDTLLLIMITSDPQQDLMKTVRLDADLQLFYFCFKELKAEEALGSLHGGCPVYEGEKVAAVKWILVDDQDMFLSPLEDGRFDIEKLLYPQTYYYNTSPIHNEQRETGVGQSFYGYGR